MVPSAARLIASFAGTARWKSWRSFVSRTEIGSHTPAAASALRTVWTQLSWYPFHSKSTAPVAYSRLRSFRKSMISSIISGSTGTRPQSPDRPSRSAKSVPVLRVDTKSNSVGSGVGWGNSQSSTPRKAPVSIASRATWSKRARVTVSPGCRPPSQNIPRPETAIQFTLRSQRFTLMPAPCSGSCGSAELRWQRRSFGNGASVSRQAPFRYIAACPGLPPDGSSAERSWLTAHSST